MKKIFTSLAMIAALAFGASAQFISNDDCITAMELDYILSADFEDEAIEFSADSLYRSSASPLNFVTFGNSPVTDVWFKFEATQTTGTVLVETNLYYDAVLEIYGGTCDNLTLLNSRNFTGTEDIERMDLGGLVVGQIYYIRVYHYNDGTPSTNGTFKIGLTSDDRCGETVEALDISVRADVSTGSFYLTAIAGSAPINFIAWDDEFGFGVTGVYNVSGYSIGDYVDVLVMDTLGCPKYVHMVMTGPLNAIIGVSEVAAQYNMSVYPNPAHNTATLSLNTAALTDLQIELVNIAGQVVYTESVAQEGAKQYNLPVADLVSGVYFVKVSSKEGIATQKLIIAK